MHLNKKRTRLCAIQLELSQARQDWPENSGEGGRIWQYQEKLSEGTGLYAGITGSWIRAKAEALRIKKKLETDINELEIALDHANKLTLRLQDN